MAGHYTAIAQTSGPINFIATGKFTQPADDNVDIHIDCGFLPRTVIFSADPTAAGTPALLFHNTHMVAGTSVGMPIGTDIATAVTLRDNWLVTTAEYYMRGGVSIQSGAGTDDYIRGFSVGTLGNGTDGDICFWTAIG